MSSSAGLRLLSNLRASLPTAMRSRLGVRGCARRPVMMRVVHVYERARSATSRDHAHERAREAGGLLITAAREVHHLGGPILVLSQLECASCNTAFCLETKWRAVPPPRAVRQPAATTTELHVLPRTRRSFLFLSEPGLQKCVERHRRDSESNCLSRVLAAPIEDHDGLVAPFAQIHVAAVAVLPLRPVLDPASRIAQLIVHAWVPLLGCQSSILDCIGHQQRPPHSSGRSHPRCSLPAPQIAAAVYLLRGRLSHA